MKAFPFAVRLLTLVFAFQICGTLAHAQSGLPVPAGVRQADRAQDRFEKSSVPPMNEIPRIDPEKLKSDANELATLAQSLVPEVDQTTRGILPKDLNDKLKKIEKLAKQLRSQINQPIRQQ